MVLFQRQRARKYVYQVFSKKGALSQGYIIFPHHDMSPYNCFFLMKNMGLCFKVFDQHLVQSTWIWKLGRLYHPFSPEKKKMVCIRLMPQTPDLCTHVHYWFSTECHSPPMSLDYLLDDGDLTDIHFSLRLWFQLGIIFWRFHLGFHLK